MNSNRVIDNLIAILKKEHSIINFSQTVEVVSLLILFRYLEVTSNLGQKKHSTTTYQNLDDYMQYCDNLLEYFSYPYREIISSKDMNRIIVTTIENLFSKISTETLFDKIIPALSVLQKESDFFLISKDYRTLIDKMVSELPALGSYTTPRVLCQIMVKILKPRNGNTIYDPVCGTGGLLLEANEYLESKKNESLGIKFKLFGNEISSYPAIIALVSFILTNKKVFHLKLADSLDSESNQDNYDIILANPPFGQSEKNHTDFFSRERLCFKEYSFLKHIMDKLKENGQAAMILPERFLYDQNKTCKDLKKQLINYFCINGILSLPPGAMLPSTNVKVIILFFSKTPPNKNVWVYQLDSVERFTRKEAITIEIFDDFIDKFKNKTVSQNSWLVPLKEFEDNNPFDHKYNNKYFCSNDEPEKYLTKLKDYQKKLEESLDRVTKKIVSINREININIKKNKFLPTKLESLIISLSTKSLLKTMLIDKGQYPVYGGNGVIGYYNNYSHSGKFIIIGRVGAYCGNVRYVEGDVWITNNAIVLAQNSNKIYFPYLAKILSYKNLRKLASGTAQPHLTMKKLNEVIIDIPPLNIQIILDQWLDELEQELTIQQEIIENINSNEKTMKDIFYRHLLGIHINKF